MATSMRLHIGRRTAVATATGLPRFARNDAVGAHEIVAWSVARLQSWPAHDHRRFGTFLGSGLRWNDGFAEVSSRAWGLVQSRCVVVYNHGVIHDT